MIFDCCYKGMKKMLQFDEYKVKLNNLLPQLDELEQALDVLGHIL